MSNRGERGDRGDKSSSKASDNDKLTKEIESKKQNNQISRELATKIATVVKGIPYEFRDFKSFSHIAVVARALKKSSKKADGPLEYLTELEQYYERLYDAVGSIVDGTYYSTSTDFTQFFFID